MGMVERQIEQVDQMVEQAEYAQRASAEANFENLSQIAMIENNGFSYVDFYNSVASSMAVKIVHAKVNTAWKLLELPAKGKLGLEVGPGKYLLKVRVDTPGKPVYFKTAAFDLKFDKQYKFTLKMSGDVLDLGTLGVTAIDAVEYAW
jgi:hypothetical protein